MNQDSAQILNLSAGLSRPDCQGRIAGVNVGSRPRVLSEVSNKSTLLFRPVVQAVEALKGGDVLRPADGLLVPDQIFPAQDRDLKPLDFHNIAIAPGTVEADTGNGGEGVNSTRFSMNADKMPRKSGFSTGLPLEQ